MKKHLLILLISIIALSCKKSDPDKKSEERKPYKIELSINKTSNTIVANNVDEVEFKATVSDINGNVLNDVIKLTVNGEVLNGLKFKTNNHGDYVFQASIGNLLSNAITIKASENLDGKPYKIEITSDKSVIKADNVEIATISIKITDIKGKIVTGDYKLSINGLDFYGTSFKTNTPGEYEFKASFAGIVSNSLKIKANENLAGKPHKIELSTDKTVINNYTIIRAYNLDVVTFKAKVTDIFGTVLNENVSITMNGNPFTGTTFKSDIPGEYNFKASIGSLTSESHTIKVRDIAEKYVTIASSRIEKINSAGLVQIGIQFTNISNKRLKYVGFTVVCYNAVGDIMREEIVGRTSYSFNATGLWEPNKQNYPSYEIGYYTGAKSIKVTLNSVTLEDNTVINY